MKKRKLLSVILLGFTLSLASCGGKGKTTEDITNTDSSETTTSSTASTSDKATHTHSYESSWTKTEEQHYHKCSGCDEKKDEEAHTFIETVVTEATCTEAGTKKKECSACGYSETYSYTITHTLGDVIPAVVATCTTDGTLEHKHCSICDKDFDLNGNEINATVEALGHAWNTNELAYDKDNHYYACSNCDLKKDLVAHTIKTTHVDSTYVEEGYDEDYCEVCGYVGEKTTIAKKPQETPTYTVPTGLEIHVGESLSVIALPDGFSFESDTNEAILVAGDMDVKLSYTVPDDTISKYETVTNIPCTISVVKNTTNVSITDKTIDKNYDGSPVVLESSDYEATEGTTTVIKYYKKVDGEFILVDEAVDAGYYKVIVSILEDDKYLASEASKEFVISQADVNLSLSTENKDYDGKPVEIEFNLPYEATITYEYKLKDAEDSAYTTVAPTDAGQYIVKATYDVNPNYNVNGYQYGSFEIFKVNGSFSLALQSSTYTGSGIAYDSSNITDIVGNDEFKIEYKLKNSSDSTYTTVAPISVGIYVVRVTMLESTNYNSVYKATELTISNVASVITTKPVVDGTVYIGQKYKDLTFKGGVTNIPGTFTAKVGYEKVSEESFEMELLFTPDDLDNYSTTTCTIEVSAVQLYINLTKSDYGVISYLGNTKVSYGSELVVSIAPASGYTIKSITVDDKEVAIVSVYTFENITENHTFDVVFEKAKTYYSLSITQTEGGTVNKSSKNLETSVEAYTKYPLEIVPDEGYYISKVVINGEDRTDNMSSRYYYSTSIDSVTIDSTVVVEFTKNHTILVKTNGNVTALNSAGTVDYTTLQTGEYTDIATIYFTPAAEYYIESLTYDGKEYELHYYEMMSEFYLNFKYESSHVIEVTTKSYPTVTIKYNIKEDVEAKIKGNTYTGPTKVKYGNNTEIYVYAIDNYYIDGATLNGVEKEITKGKGYFYLNDSFKADVEIVVTLVENPKVTFNYHGGTGYVSNNEAGAYPYDSVEQFEYNYGLNALYFFADPEYHFEKITFNGTDYKYADKYSTNIRIPMDNIVSDLVFDIYLAYNPKITSAVTGNGTAKISSPTGDDFTNSSYYVSYPYGTQVVYFVPDDGYILYSLDANGEVDISNGYDGNRCYYIYDIDADVTLTAVFTKRPVINVTMDSSYGTMTYAGKDFTSSPQDIGPHRGRTVNVTAAKGYIITSIKANGVELLEDIIDSGESTNVELQVDGEDLNVVVLAEKKEYTFTQKVDSDLVKVTADKDVFYYGDEVTITVELLDDYSQSTGYYVFIGDAIYSNDHVGDEPKLNEKNQYVLTCTGDLVVTSTGGITYNSHKVNVKAIPTDWGFTDSTTRVLYTIIKGNVSSGGGYSCNTGTSNLEYTICSNHLKLEIGVSEYYKSQYHITGIYLSLDDYNKKTNDILSTATLNSDGRYEIIYEFDKDDTETLMVYVDGEKGEYALTFTSNDTNAYFYVQSDYRTLVTDSTKASNEYHVSEYTGSGVEVSSVVNTGNLTVNSGSYLRLSVYISSNLYYQDILVDGKSILDNLQIYSFDFSTRKEVSFGLDRLSSGSHTLEVVTTNVETYFVETIVGSRNEGVAGTVSNKKAMAEAGKKYTITATPSAGYLAVFFLSTAKDTRQDDSNEFSFDVYEPTQVYVVFQRTSDYVTFIKTEEDLINIKNDPCGYYKLSNDITLTKPWITTNFYGVLDGGDYTISNLSIDPSQDNAIGFFAYTYGARIFNLKLEDVNIDYVGTYGAYKNVGTLIGYAEGTEVENVRTSGTIKCTVSNLGTAGFIGSIRGSSYLYNCSSNMTVIGITVAGFAAGINNSILVDCDANCTVQSSSSSDMAGFANSVYGSELKNCTFDGNITGTMMRDLFVYEYYRVSGFVGVVEASEVTNCRTKAIVDVNYKGCGVYGGFVGWAYKGTVIENCTAEGSANLTGVFGSDESGRPRDNFISGFAGFTYYNMQFVNCTTYVNVKLNKTKSTTYSSLYVNGFTCTYGDLDERKNSFDGCDTLADIEVADLTFETIYYSNFSNGTMGIKSIYDTFDNCKYMNTINLNGQVGTDYSNINSSITYDPDLN